jgi:hypothetical protein
MVSGSGSQNTRDAETQFNPRVERRAHKAIVELAGAEPWKPESRIQALMQLSG